jgi:hypothetical protein
VNLYSYVGGAPTSLIDPLGLAAQLCCKKLMYPANEYYHCYVNIDSASGPHETWGLHTAQTVTNYAINMPLGNAVGTVEHNNPFDKNGDKGQCGPWSESPCGDPEKCVADTAKSYPSPSPYYLSSQNSNTFASYVANKCKLKPPPVVWEHFPNWPYVKKTPGWFGQWH